jgi:hypothetical protein
MAFNPFATFQRNKKFWMAMMTLLAMVTFVFCTGMGDMQDRIIRWFGSRGPTVMKVAGTSFSSYDLHRLRDERAAVNQFMKAACRATIENVTQDMQKVQKEAPPADDKQNQQRKEALARYVAMHGVLVKRLAKPNYFDGGTKLDDLVEFKLWQAQADRLGIRLSEEDIDGETGLLRLEFFRYILPDQLAQARRAAFSGKDFTDAGARRAILEEFRVRLARLALYTMRPGYFVAHPQPPVIPDAVLPNEDRVPITLAELWDVYKKERSEYDVTLIPIQVGDLTKDVKEPSETALTDYFEKHRTKRYDPESPLPSFESPKEIKVEFLMADPTSPIYGATARAQRLLLTTLPLAANLLNSPVVTAARYGAASAEQLKAEQDLLEAMGTRRFEDYPGAYLSAADLRTPMAIYLAERDPKAVASLVGNIAASFGDPGLAGVPAVAGMRAFPESYQGDRLQAGMAAEAKSRALPYAKLAVAGLTGQPLDLFTSAMINLHQYPAPVPSIHPGRQVLPLPVIAPELEAIMENRTAEQWASNNLRKMKRLIDDNNKTETIKMLIKEYVDGPDPAKNLHLTHVITKGYYNQFNIDKAPELQPLRQQFEKYYDRINWYENRSVRPEKVLKEGDFYKLFFDNEPFFSSNAKYKVLPWPPVVEPSPLQVMALPGQRQLDLQGIPEQELAAVQQYMQQLTPSQPPRFSLLDEAQKPILFWERDEKPPELPLKRADAGSRVRDAWLLEQAREHKALPLAKKIADQLREAGGDFSSELVRRAGDQAGRTPIVLPKIAPMAPKLSGDPLKRGTRVYAGYHLPKDVIVRPRDDMVAQLLSLYDLKAPIEIHSKLLEGGAEPTFVKMVNDLNKELFDKVKKEKEPKGLFVQVLTNKPQTVYYVAVVSRRPNPYDKAQRDDFTSALKFASEATGLFVDTFAERAQQMLATSFHKQLVEQMKTELGYTPPDEKVQQDFDKSAQGI